MPVNFAIKLVATVALQAAQMGLQAMQRVRGPRLSELSVTTADFGTPLPRFLGARKFSCAITHAEDLKEVKHTSKGKAGPKQTSYSYLATFDATICDVPIEKVLKIWLDEHLCYDVTGSGPVTPIAAFLSGNHAAAPPVKLTNGDNMRIYLGTEDQLPDPRYVEYCEGKHGPDSAPASRGVAHIFFEEIPTDNFGNRIPQVTVLVATAVNPHYSFEINDNVFATDQRAKFSPDFTRLYNVDINDSVFVWDVATRTQMLTFPSNVGGVLGVSANTLYGRGSDGLLAINPDGGEAVLTTVFDFASTDVFFVGGLVCLTPFGGLIQATHYFSGDDVIGVIATATDFIPTMYFEDLDGNAWAVGQVPGENKVGFLQMPSGAAQLVDTTDDGQAYAMCNEAGQFLTWQEGKLFIVDPDTWTAGSPVTASTGTTSPLTPFNNIAPGTKSIWLHGAEYDTSDASLIRTVTFSNWHAGVAGGVVYDPINHALITGLSGGGTIWLFLDRSANAGVQLGDIVSKLCTDAGMTGYDVSLLTDAVEGYSWTIGAAKAQMEPVLDIHDTDARPHDFTIEFRPRGTAPSGTILTADFARSGDNPRYRTAEPQDTDLPKMLRVNFADSSFDQQPNNVLSPLPADAVDSQRDTVIDLTTYVSTSDDAQRKADRYMRGLWNRRARVDNALTAQSHALEPGDTTTLSLDGILWACKLDRQSFVGTTRMECTFVRDESAVALLNPATTGPPMDGRDPDTITIPAPVRGFVVDAPLREDSDADIRPLLYTGAGAYAQLGFPGAVIFEASGTGDSLVYDQMVGTVTGGATWGLCQDTLGDIPIPWLWDRGNSLTVSLQSGSLTSVSEADIDADPELNLLLVGAPGRWEYVNVTTPTLNGDGSYTLTGFKRGRRGTEWACGLHQAGDAWVLASALEAQERGSDDLGDDLSFKVQAIGRDPNAAFAIDIAPYQGQSLMPRAPARVIWTTDGTDMFGEIVRCTRTGGAWVGGSTIPLGENSEAYEVDVYNGATFKRTIAAIGTNAFTYAAADIAADGNTVGVAPPSNAYQMSDTVGRGFALAA